MKRFLSPLMAISMLMCVAVPIIHAEEPPSITYGRITGKCSPAGANITLYDSNYNNIKTVTADEEGNYVFENVLPGNGYIITGFKYDYVSVTENDIIVIAGETTIVNIALPYGDDTPSATMDPNSPTFVCGTVTGCAGGIVDVPITISENPGIYSAQFEMYYSENKMRLISVTNGIVFPDNMLNYNISEDNGCVVVNLSSNKIIADNGELFIARFKINDELPDNKITLTFNAVEYTDESLEKKYVKCKFGKIEIEDYGRIAGRCHPSGASVVLYDSHNNKIAETISDENENYAFDNVPPGTGYSITGHKYDYVLNSEYDITVASGKTTIVDIFLPSGDNPPKETMSPNMAYIINSLKLVSESGTEYDTPPADTSFIVDVDITEIVKRDSKDYFIVAAYDTNGALISMNYIKADLSVGSYFSFGVNIPKTDKSIGSIKAFVWDALGGMTPLAESKSIECSTPSLIE